MGRTTRHFNNALWEKGDAPKKLRAVLKEKTEKYSTWTSFSNPSVACMIAENLNMSEWDNSRNKYADLSQQLSDKEAKIFAATGHWPNDVIWYEKTWTSFSNPSVAWMIAENFNMSEWDNSRNKYADLSQQLSDKEAKIFAATGHWPNDIIE